MIQPMPEKGYITNFADYQDKWIFYLGDDGSCGFAMFTNSIYHSHKWSVDLYGPPINDWDYFIRSETKTNHNKATTRAMILDFIRDNYPDQFVWCLFHPESFP